MPTSPLIALKASPGPSTFQTWGIPWITGVAGLILGGPLSLFLTGRKERPTPVLRGGGNSSLPLPDEYVTRTVTVENRYGFVGIRQPEARIGPVYLESCRYGSTLWRNAAYDCQAQLFDRNRKHIAQLRWWLGPKNPDEIREAYPLMVTLDCNKSAQLILFMRHTDDMKHYFAFECGADNLPQKPKSKFGPDGKFMLVFASASGGYVSNVRIKVEVTHENEIRIKVRRYGFYVASS